MKTLLATAVLLCSGMVFSQQETTETKPLEPIQKAEHVEYKGATHSEVNQTKSVTISKRPGQAQRVHDLAYYNEEIAKIDARVAAIDTKIAYVNATPSEKTIADQNGWFQKMEQIKEELNERRTTLVVKRDNL